MQIDQAVSRAFLEAVQPAAIEAALAAAEQLEADGDAALAQWRREVERKRYRAQRAERRYRAVDPDNGLVARGLEAEWEQDLRDLAQAEAELARREHQRRRTVSPIDRQALRALGADLRRVWSAPSTTDRDRKGLLRSLLAEVIIAIDRAKFRADLTLRWRGGAITELEVGLPRSNPPTVRTANEPEAIAAFLIATGLARPGSAHAWVACNRPGSAQAQVAGRARTAGCSASARGEAPRAGNAGPEAKTSRIVCNI